MPSAEPPRDRSTCRSHPPSRFTHDVAAQAAGSPPLREWPVPDEARDPAIQRRGGRKNNMHGLERRPLVCWFYAHRGVPLYVVFTPAAALGRVPVLRPYGAGERGPMTTVETERRVRRITERHTGGTLLRSVPFLLRDLASMYIIARAFALAREFVPASVLFLPYSAIMGTAALGPWVLAHECGHGAFGATRLQNDIIGYTLHSMLLVPYFAWQHTHGKHHRYTNHLVHGETHVPLARGDLMMRVEARLRSILGQDAFVAGSLAVHLLFGWPAYLFANVTSGRGDAAAPGGFPLPRDHFTPFSRVLPGRLWKKTMLGTFGCLATVVLVARLGLVYQYFGPYLVVNAWLVVYTYLQHTDKTVPHFGEGAGYRHATGALCTVDRPYPRLVDHMHHHIGSTHVAHHLNPGVPHYRAVKCTEEIRAALGDSYRFDPTPQCRALWNTLRDCSFVEDRSGKQFYVGA